MYDITLQDLLNPCDIYTKSQFCTALDCVQKKFTVICKRNPRERNTDPYNTVMSSLFQRKTNIQFIMYGVLAYIMAYIWKPEPNMSELMKNVSKEAYWMEIKNKLRSTGNVFLTKREMSTHEAIKTILSLKMETSNIKKIYILTELKKNRTRLLKNSSELTKINPV